MSNDKAQKSKSDSRSRGKKIRGDKNQPKVNCIIQFKDPKPSDESIKAKFTESDGADVSEVICRYKTSDNQASLVLLMNRMVTLGDLYDMFENGKSKKLTQTVSRALDGQVRDDWIEIVNNVDDWENYNKKREFIRLLKRLGSEAFGSKAFKNQCKAMESRMLKIPESNLWVGTYQLIQINKMLPYLGLQAKSYDIGDLNMEPELARQCLIGCLGRLTPEQFEERKWAFPAFGIPKKNGTVRFVIDFHRINVNLIRRKFPLWTTEEILMSIFGFLYATSIDLNMGYPSIPLNDKARKILPIIMPFGAFECLTLPMGVMQASDLFQSRMVHMFAGMNERRPFPYIDNVLHFKGATFEEHISILDEILALIGNTGMQVCADKSCFCQESMEYLGFQLHRTCYTPLPSRARLLIPVLGFLFHIPEIQYFSGFRGFLQYSFFLHRNSPKQ
jgi:hypothetical protein